MHTNTAIDPIWKPLTVTLNAQYGGLVRRFAHAQRCTYASAVAACIQAQLQSGGPVVLEPWGEPARAALLGVESVESNGVAGNGEM